MHYYPSGLDLPFVIPILDEDGSVTTAQSISYRVVNAIGTVLVNWTALTGYTGDNDAEVTIPASVNTTTSSRDVRVIELRCTASSGAVFVVQYVYGLESGTGALVRFENTAVMTGQAELIADELDLQVWSTSPKHKKVNVLLESYRRLKGLQFEVRGPDCYHKCFRLRDLSAPEIAALDSTFLEALSYAQVAECESILNFDPEEEKRRDYLLMDTIGESKQMYRTVKPADLGISSATKKYLAAYLKPPSLSIGRG